MEPDGKLFRDSARVAHSADEAVRGADVVLTMRFDADADAVSTVLGDALPALAENAIWMQSSTIGTQASAEFARLAGDARVRYVDAPMLGTGDPAAHGRLTALVADVAALAPVLAEVASRTVRVGDAAAASALKLAANVWIAMIAAGKGQSLTIAERLGVAQNLVLAAWAGTVVDSRHAQLKGGEMLTGRFDPQFEEWGLLKDVRLVCDETPQMSDALLDALEELYSDTAETGSGHEDLTAAWKASRR